MKRITALFLTGLFLSCSLTGAGEKFSVKQNFNVGNRFTAEAATGNIETAGDITTVGALELGHASDTTIARSGSGAVTVEGVQVILSGGNAGTPSALVGTNISGTAASFTAGNVTTNANLTGIVTSVGNATSIHTSINTPTDNYTLVIGDDHKLIAMNKATAVNLTIPLNSSVAFPTGTTVAVWNKGAGIVTFVATGGVTINTQDGLVMTAQHAMASIIKVGTDEWVLCGSLETP